MSETGEDLDRDQGKHMPGEQGEPELRRSERQVKPSLKVKENHEAQFWTIVKGVTATARQIDRDLTADCSPSMKIDMEREVRNALEDLEVGYEQLRSFCSETLSPDARQAADRWKSKLKNLLDRLQPAETSEISFGSKSTTSSKRALLAAKAAALQVEIEAKRIEGEQKRELARLEAKERARQAEIQAEIERKKQEIEDKRLEMELKKTEAEMSALDLDDDSRSHRTHSEFKLPKVETLTRPSHGMLSATTDLTKMFTETLNLSRLPPPEPFVFDGNPLCYPSWKTAFHTLIVERGIPPAERIHYLRKYLAGEAMEAIEGLFNFNTEEAYLAMCNVLERRFGNPFSIAEGYRDRIKDWPRIQPGDGKGLRRFADFLRQCLVAVTHIPSLSILDDCRENKNMISKLPDWLVRSWSRIVTEEMDRGTYPKFARFVEFLDKEAEIMCNPVTTSLPDRQSSTRNKPPKRSAANLFAVKEENQMSDKPATGAQSKRVQPSSHTDDVKICRFCNKLKHLIDDCWGFKKLTAGERQKYIMAKGLCFRCLEQGHLSKGCQSKSVCKNCGKKHPTSLCGDYETLKESTEATTDDAGRSFSSNTDVISAHMSSPSSMIVPVFLSSQERQNDEVLVYALLDTQSDTSFVSEETLDALQVSTTDTVLKLTTMTNTSRIECRRAANLLVRGYQSNKKLVLPTVYSRNFIPSNLDHIPTKAVTRQWPHLNSLTHSIPDKQDCEVGILIGYDCPQALAPVDVIRGQGNQPFGVKTELGWSVVGKTMATPESLSHTVITKMVPDDVITHKEGSIRNEVCLVHRTKVREEFPTTEIIRILESDFKEQHCDASMSQEDIRFIENLQQNIHQDSDGYYEMPLPFRGDRPLLPDSEHIAKKRLDLLKKRLKSNAQYAEDYKKFMSEILRRGEAEPVPLDELKETKRWYIPHHGVYHPKKPGKIRVVFDCSAQSCGTSLNDHLLQGPELMNNLVGVLCRFREKPIAVMGDVEKMFHQFRVEPKDRNYLRFLWWEGGDIDSEPTVYRMKVHLFGATSSPGCANFGLKQLATDYRNDYDEVVSDFLMRNVYVDDGLGSFNNEEEAISVVRDLRSLCSKGNLRLHKFISNSAMVMKSIPESEYAPEMMVELPQESQIGRVLGVEWQVHADVFQFKLTISQKPVTRRGILATVASVYDPLGFLAPFILLGKQILQQMCADRCGWDEELSDELKPKWERWLVDLGKLSDLTIQRCFLPDTFGKPKKVELHHFSDASYSGYGQCTYLRAKNENDQVFCSLVMGKSRVAPLKVVTLPRLELTAAVTSVRISSFLRTEITFENIQEFFWTDSKIVIGYIQNDARRFHVYVANRVQRIRDSSNPQQWKYVTSKENPADCASRGLSAEELMKSRWLTGPRFLWNSELPDEEQFSTQLSSHDPEVKAVVNVASTRESKTVLERFQKFSDWKRLVMAVSAILKTICLKRAVPCQNVKEEAEKRILRAAQAVEFEEEISILKAKGVLPKGNRLSNLDPFIDEDDLLRVGGRIKRSKFSFQIKHPVILPHSGHISELVIKLCHQGVAHQGRGFTLNELRSRGYWIIRGSRAVSSVIFKCVICRRLRGKNLGQKMGDLPVDRVEEAAPFSHCGLDCFGPFFVREGRRELKRYGLLITCMASRAIHVELLDDMTTDAFINGLRCFIAIRGPVQTIRCDQGSNFVGADKELKRACKEMKNDQIRDYLEKQSCQFMMNSPHSSHMGGCWERHIRTIRSILATMLHQHKGRLDTSTLRTFLYEVMAIVNSRPLTAQDLNDPHIEPLTPNHLLMPLKTKIVLTPPGEFTREDVYARKRWRKVQHLANEFWSRWKRDYISTLQTRQKWHKVTRNLKEGDIVLLTDEEFTRGEWQLARVHEAIPDKDNLVRKVKLVRADRNLTNSGKRISEPAILERPVHMLRLLLESEE